MKIGFGIFLYKNYDFSVTIIISIIKNIIDNIIAFNLKFIMKLISKLPDIFFNNQKPLYPTLIKNIKEKLIFKVLPWQLW